MVRKSLDHVQTAKFSKWIPADFMSVVKVVLHSVLNGLNHEDSAIK